MTVSGGTIDATSERPATRDEGWFSLRDTARIFGLKEARLRYWAQTGFINPRRRADGKPVYTFADLVEIKAAKELLERNIPLQRVRRHLQALRQALPGQASLLARLRVLSDGDRLVVVEGQALADPLSGQLLLDFAIGELTHHVAQVLRLPLAAAAPRGRGEAGPTAGGGRAAFTPPPGAAGAPAGARPPLGYAATAPGAGGATDATAGAPLSAYDWFLRGLACESEAEDELEAAAAYERAIGLDPGLAAAQTNLGTLHYRRGDRAGALRCYTAALALDPDQPESHYNLANLYEEDGEIELALAEYRCALKLNADFADAHFNLALTLERVGSRLQAAEHWRRYLGLTETAAAEHATWRAVAQEHLRRLHVS